MKKLLLKASFSLFFCYNLSAQTSSYESAVTLVSNSLDSLTTDQTIVLTITFSTTIQLGGVSLVIYNSSDDSFVEELNYDIASLQSSGFINGNVVTIPLWQFTSGVNYRFDINPFELDNAFLEKSEFTTNF